MAAPPPTQLGNQTRTQMLPETESSSDFLGPDYSYADELPLPGQIGVRSGDSLASVIDATKGALYYADMMGYGEASNFMTRSMGTKPFPLGVNYFLRTGGQCSNGADMWYYVNGIPEGTALGSRLQKAMKSMGLPQLRGLAPGIAEDAKAALDPTPLLNAVFGSGYAQCKQVTLPVGDFNGKIESQDGVAWIRPLFPGDLQNINVDGKTRPAQRRWVFDKWLTQEEFSKATKSHCPDGSLIVDHQENKCEKPLKITAPATASAQTAGGTTARPSLFGSGRIREGWEDYGSDSSVAVVAVLLALVSIGYRYSK